MAYNYQHPQYLAARAEAFARSGDVCQILRTETGS